MADNPQEFDFPIGKVVGRKGDTGNGISSIELLETVGLSKTYRITMTDETYVDFTVTDGNGISGVSYNPETYTLTLTFDNGTSFTTGSLRGAPGQKGDDGYSPAVTITTITGGHRVTITDADHPQGQTFDVMDGMGNVTSVAGKTGAVTLDGNDISFNPEDDYDDGTVGKALKDELNAISQNEESIADTQSMIATVEATTTASKNYAVGDLLVYDGKLYKVSSAIATGATIIVGSNVTQTTVENQLASASSGNAKWTLIVDDTTTEDKSQIDYDISSEQWHKVLGIMATPANGQTGQNINARAFSDVLPEGGGHVCLYATGQNRSQYITYATFVIDCSTGRHFADYTAGQYALSNGMSNRTIRPDMMGTDIANYYTKIRYIGDFPAGTTVQLYGIK